MDIEDNIVKAYNEYIINNISKNILIRIVPALIIMLFFVYHDVFVIKVFKSVYLRLLVIIPLVIIFFVKIFYPNKRVLIFWGYMSMLALVPVMMYGKIIMHFNNPNLQYSSILGTILVIFIISLEFKVKLKYLLYIYLVSFVIFIIIFFIYNNNIYMVVLNIVPIIIIGIIFNTLLNKLLYKQYSYSYLLQQEKQIVEKQNSELQLLNNTKNKLFSIISHDLKNPFNIVMGFTEVLKDNYDNYSDKERKNFINEINSSSTVVYGLLDNLLQWSFIQLNVITLKKESIKIKHFIDEVVVTQQLNAGIKEIKLVNSIKNEISVEIDKHSILIILNNLISNAIKFSFVSNNVIIKAVLNNNQLVFSVQDFGVGIEKPQIEKLFVIDGNFSTVGTGNEKGSGLGLILCKEIVERNNGEIWVESVKEKGSTFYFSIPV